MHGTRLLAPFAAACVLALVVLPACDAPPHERVPKHSQRAPLPATQSGGFLPTPSEERRLSDQALELKLQRLLEIWPDVIEVRAQVSGTDGSRSATVVISHAPGAVPQQRQIEDTVAHAIDATDRHRVHVALVPRSVASSQPMASVGPFSVAQASAPQLRATLLGTLGITAILAGLLLWRLRGPRRAH